MTVVGLLQMVPLMKIFIIQIDYTLWKKENLKLAKSIFNSIEVSNDTICSNHNEFSKLYKMDVSFKLNNTDFPLLAFPSASMSVLSVSASLPLLQQGSLFPAILILVHLNHLLLLLIHLLLVFLAFYKLSFLLNLYLTLLTLLFLTLPVALQLNTIIGPFANPFNHLNLLL